MKDLLFLQERLGRAFDEALSGYKENTTGWTPPADIYETEHDVVLKVELPGISPESVSLEVRENSIAIKGEKQLKRNLLEEHCHRMERFYGSFQRTFVLPSVVDKTGVNVTSSNGVLVITIPKAGKSKRPHELLKE